MPLEDERVFYITGVSRDMLIKFINLYSPLHMSINTKHKINIVALSDLK